MYVYEEGGNEKKRREKKKGKKRKRKERRRKRRRKSLRGVTVNQGGGGCILGWKSDINIEVMSHNSHSWGRILMRELDGLVPLWRSNFEIISSDRSGSLEKFKLCDRIR